MPSLEGLLPDWIDAAAEEARTVALGMLRERGRGAVLVGVARVDAALESLLRAALNPPRGSETLFHSDRPLGSFGAKIALAARLGLIDAAVEQALNSLRRVRNAFAHSSSEVCLADPPFRDRLKESLAHARGNSLWQPMEIILSNHIAISNEVHSPGIDPVLADFVLLITILVAFIETAARMIRPMRPTLTMTFALGITSTTTLE